MILRCVGDLYEATVLHKREERIWRDLGNEDLLTSALGSQALTLQASGDLKGAMCLFQEAEHICRRLGKVEGIAFSLTSQAILLAFHADKS